MEKEIPIEAFRRELYVLVAYATSRDYAHDMIDCEEFVNSVKRDVEETSAWRDEGFYSEDDIRLAIGRTLVDKLNIGND